MSKKLKAYLIKSLSDILTEARKKNKKNKDGWKKLKAHLIKDAPNVFIYTVVSLGDLSILMSFLWPPTKRRLTSGLIVVQRNSCESIFN
jgi:hypothetical protein